MQSGAPTFGTPEPALVLYVMAALARRLGVPFRSGGSLCGSKIADAQAAYESAATLQPTVLGAALMLFTLSAWFADFIGLHAVFGSFLIGTAMPRGVFAVRLKQLLEPFALVFLLPVFFTYSGLNTQLTMVNTAPLRSSRSACGVHLRQVRRAGPRLGWEGWTIAKRSNRCARERARLTELIILNIGLSPASSARPCSRCW